VAKNKTELTTRFLSVEREDTWEGSRPRDPFFAKPGMFRNPGSSNA
jgi:hypothetical protein